MFVIIGFYRISCKNVSVSESKLDYELTTEHSLEKWGENARQIG